LGRRISQKFFEAANRYEDRGNRRFKELEMSLPNELTLEQNLEIVKCFISKHLSNLTTPLQYTKKRE
jgi:hypothetical protein